MRISSKAFLWTRESTRSHRAMKSSPYVRKTSATSSRCSSIIQVAAYWQLERCRAGPEVLRDWWWSAPRCQSRAGSGRWSPGWSDRAGSEWSGGSRPHPTGEWQKHGFGGKIFGRIQKKLDFGGAQNHGELLFVPRQRNAIEGNGNMQCVGVKKAECADGQNIGRKRNLLLLDQVELIFSDLFCAQQVRRFAEVFGELSDVANVGSNGAWGVVANLEILQH